MSTETIPTEPAIQDQSSETSLETLEEKKDALRSQIHLESREANQAFMRQLSPGASALVGYRNLLRGSNGLDTYIYQTATGRHIAALEEEYRTVLSELGKEKKNSISHAVSFIGSRFQSGLAHIMRSSKTEKSSA